MNEPMESLELSESFPASLAWDISPLTPSPGPSLRRPSSPGSPYSVSRTPFRCQLHFRFDVPSPTAFRPCSAPAWTCLKPPCRAYSDPESCSARGASLEAEEHVVLSPPEHVNRRSEHAEAYQTSNTWTRLKRCHHLLYTSNSYKLKSCQLLQFTLVIDDEWITTRPPTLQTNSFVNSATIASYALNRMQG